MNKLFTIKKDKVSKEEEEQVNLCTDSFSTNYYDINNLENEEENKDLFNTLTATNTATNN